MAVTAAASPAASDALAGVGLATAEHRHPAQPPGRIVAVWGPVGSPGRTSVAITLADELARGGVPVLLVDADTYGSAVGVHLGLLDDTSGVAAATRLSAVGRLDAAALARAAVALPSGLAVLTGIARPGRWPELRPASLQAVLQLAALHYAWVVVDVGFGLGSGVVPSAGLGPPDRDDATVATLAVCDSLVAVGSADTVGLVRLVRDLPSAVDAAPAAELCVVVNRVRRSTVGRRPTSQLAALLDAHVRSDDLVLVPDDPHAFDLALCTGRTLAEVAADSAARDALRGLAGRFAPPPGHRSRRRPSLRRGLRRTG
jgi:MinD-like ATPase involved in chromosome partitioning or flagellar assembly